MDLRPLLASCLAVLATAATPPKPPHNDWLQFTSPPPTTPSLNRQTITQLGLKWHITLPERIDSSPLYVDDVATDDGIRDIVIVETITGRVQVLDAHEGTLVWEAKAPEGPRWTTSSPAVDPGRRFLYAYGLDGYVHKYVLANGHEVIGKGWPQLITTKGEVEKGSSAISIATNKRGSTYLYMPISAYPIPGDDGDYQGHLVTINLDTGEQNVFNALCSDKSIHFIQSLDEQDCAATQAGIWARAGAVYDKSLDRVYVSIGNGVFDADRGGYNWASSVVALRPDGSVDKGAPLDSYTPEDYQRLNDEDLDLSSSNVEILPVAGDSAWHVGVLIGKDGVLRLLNLADLSGKGGPRHLGGELQTVDILGNRYVVTRPVAWLDPETQKTWVFIASTRGMAALELTADENGGPHLEMRWVRQRLTTSSPILTGELLFCATNDSVLALDPKTGATLWRNQTIGSIHWQTPIVVSDSLYIADEDNGLYCFENRGRAGSDRSHARAAMTTLPQPPRIKEDALRKRSRQRPQRRRSRSSSAQTSDSRLSIRDRHHGASGNRCGALPHRVANLAQQRPIDGDGSLQHP
jgi:outer membrane protein assembly factor BamB